MASPFSIFRKRQKFMLAALFIIAMGGFVVLPMMMQRMGTGGRTDNPVAVKTTKYGALRMADLDGLRRDRLALANFVRDVGSAIAENGGDSRLAQNLQNNQFYQSDNETVVRNWLLAHRAEELGVRIGDEAILRHIGGLFEGQEDPTTGLLVGRVDKPTVAKILRENQLSEQQLVGLFRRELLANRAYSVFERSLAGVTPGQRWDCYQRLHRQIAIQTIAEPVSKYISQVDEPDEAVLEAFFEEHKENTYNPNSPDPGFFVPKRIRLEYFVGNRELLLQSAMEKISDEEVQAYYEENREFYRKPVLPELPAEQPPVEGPVEGETPANDPPAEQPPAEGETPASDPPAEQAPVEGPVEGDAPASDPPAEQPPVEETPPASDPPAEPVPSPEESDSSSVSKASPFRLTAYQAAPVADPPAVVEQPAVPTEPVPAAVEGDMAADPSATISELVDDITGKTDETEYKSLEEVKDEIKEHLAGLVVADGPTELRAEMVVYRDDRIGRMVDESSEQSVQAHQALDQANYEAMVEMAEGLGMTAQRTELLAAWEIAELDIGRSRVSSRTAFVNYAFQSLTEFRPEMSEDSDSYYVFRKIEETEARAAKFEEEEIRKQVLDAWKTIEAGELALAAAEKLAAEAADTTLEEKFGARMDLAVVESQPFSWLTGGSLPIQLQMQMQPQLSRIEKKQEDLELAVDAEEAVRLPGQDFMRMVFGLETNEIGVAANEPKTEYYVVQVIESNPPTADLQRNFFSDRMFQYSFPMVYRSELSDVQIAWFEQLEKEAGLEWTPEAERGRR